MVVTPNSRIRLLKSPIELDEKNQLTFSNITAQTNYFLSLPYLEYDNCSYQRKDNVIRYETEPNGITYEDLLKYNYCMYQNTSYDDKWFYAFITSVRYINDGMTEITIETDVIETWKFDIVYKTSFVEREHVSDDTIGLHTYPEGLETGEYVNVEEPVSSSIGDDISICVATSKHINANKTVTTPNGRLISGIYQGLDFAIFSDYPNYSGCKKKEDAVNLYMFYFANTSGVSQDDIVDIFMIPTSIIGSNYTEIEYQYDAGTVPFKVKFLTSTTSEILLETYLLKDNSNLAGSYVPKNNKLLCHPYRYLLASNGTGQDVVYKWEDFVHSNTNHITFKTKGVLTPNCSIKCIPFQYKNMTNASYDNLEDAINFSKFPTCSWIYDAYTNWLTQNGVNNSLRTLGGLVKVGSGAMSLASGLKTLNGAESMKEINLAGSNINSGATSIGGGLHNIFEVAMEQYEHTFDSNQSRGNVNSGDINFTISKNNIYFYKMSIKPEYSRIIDGIFSKFGYKVNTMKVPQFESRTNWNYIKTIDINLLGDIPQEDMQKIKNIFNSGITFWHNPNTFLDYSQSNTIVS